MVGYSMRYQTIVAISYTKQRTAFGMVGIEIDLATRLAYVRLAKIWKRDNMNVIPNEIKQINEKIKWDMTFADQLIGQHLIRSIEKSIGYGVYTITTQKNLKDPEDIELIKVMDMTEMTQLTLSLKQEHVIQFPPKNHTKDMVDLIKQIEMFTEHTTESGTVAYYAPGDELDCLTKALMICLFGGRQLLRSGLTEMIVRQGTPLPKTSAQSFDGYFSKILGDDFGGMSVAELNNTDHDRIFKRTTRKW